MRRTQAPKTYAVAASEDRHTLEAAIMTYKEGSAIPILIGDEMKIRSLLDEMGESTEGLEIINITGGAESSVQKAVNLVNENRAQFIVKGLIETSVYLKVVLRHENKLRREGIVSVVTFMEIPTYHKLLCITDGALNMYPDLSQKKEILKNAVETMNRSGIEDPKVAVLCAVEKINPKMPETVDAAALKQMNLSGEIPGCIVEGPISYDIAVSKDAAKIKGFCSPVAGDADILLMPNITTGNIGAKMLLYSGGATSAAIAVGLRVPLVITSRSATVEEKYKSILLATVGDWS